MCMIDGCDRADVFRDRHRVARKEHKCSECGRVIFLGERYEVATGLWEGRWDTFKTCAHCEAVREWLRVVCNGWAFAGVYEDLREHRNEGYNPRWLSIAISGMGRKWRKADGTLWRPMTLPKNLPIGTNT